MRAENLKTLKQDTRWLVYIVILAALLVAAIALMLILSGLGHTSAQPQTQTPPAPVQKLYPYVGREAVPEIPA